jgi:hypothetical protein
MPLSAFAYPVRVAWITSARFSLHFSLACMLKGMAPTPHVVMPRSWKMWLKGSFTSASLSTSGVYYKSTWSLSHFRNVPLSLSNSLLLIVMKLGQKVVQNLHIHLRVILNPHAILSSRWVLGLVWLHGNILLQSQMPHQVVLAVQDALHPSTLQANLGPSFA